MSRSISFAQGYVRRVIDDELDELLQELPAVLLDGPKGVGKTATATRRCATVRRLDVDSERAVVEADPFTLRDDPKPTLIDEWQRVPSVWNTVRRLVDENRAGAQYLLTGSAPSTTAGTHSGAGRITTMRMRPLTLFERRPPDTPVSFKDLLAGVRTVRGGSPLTLSDYVDEITAGGFPGLRDSSPRARERELDEYLERIAERDFPEMGHRLRQPALLRNWMRAYAAATATTTAFSKIREFASSGRGGPSEPTAGVFVEILRALRILDPIPGWSPSHNHLRQLTQTEKHHLADPALATRLVRRSATQLRGGAEPGIEVPRDGTFLGALFESLAALSVRTFAQNANAEVYHLRQHGGRHEVDFIVERADGGVLALEAKLAGTVSDADVKHLFWLREQLGDEMIDLAVIHTGSEAYRRRDGVAVIPLALLGP